MGRAIYKMNFDYGRHGNLYGIFVANKDYVKLLVSKEISILFGEVLGKHSEVIGHVSSGEIDMISDKTEDVEYFERLGLESGYNPFSYQCVNYDDLHEEIDDLTVYDLCKILHAITCTMLTIP
jgi:hypothetical protein